MNRSLKAVVIGSVALSTLLPTTDAMAKNLYSEVKHRSSAYSKGSNARVAAKDWANDGNAVKAEYRRKSSAGKVRSLWNKSGKGTVATSGSGSRIFTLRSCHQRRHKPDKCGKWDA